MFKTTLIRAILLLVTAGLGSAHADHSDKKWSNEKWNAEHVVAFEHCDFQGRSKSLPIGDYAKIRSIGIDNNRISSLIIPAGMAVEVFQKNNYRGHWYRINRNQACLKGNWNDSISSLRVLADDPQNSFGLQDSYRRGDGASGCFNYQVYSPNGDGAVRFVEKERRLNTMQSNRLDGQICQTGLVRVELAKQRQDSEVVLRVNNREYSFARSQPFDDFRNKWYRKYLSINLPDQNYQMDEGARAGWGNTRGFGRRYSSGIPDGENWGNDYPRGWWKPREEVAVSNDDVQENCIAYTVQGRGRDTGIRFLNVKEFAGIGNNTVNDKVCHSGTVLVELAKKHPNEEVTLRIQGKSYRFPAGDTGDRYERYWYRKYYRLNL
ncbi:MAG: hypothetical protein AAF402_02880 [Pseudomonadota bacterium]